MTPGADGPATTADGRLDRLRTEPRAHAAGLVVATGLGVLAAWLDPLGLVVGGALVGLVAASLRRAILYGLAFGVLVLVVFALSLGTTLGPAVGMVPAVYLTLGAGVGMPVLGSLVRGLV